MDSAQDAPIGENSELEPEVQNIDAYIAGFPPEIQAILERIRSILREAAPDAVEAIKYQLPTFVLHGNLVHFGAFRSHIGFYPAPTAIERFREKLAGYKGAKGSVQFPLDAPIPYHVIEEIVKFRVQENLNRAEEKRKRDKAPVARSASGPAPPLQEPLP